MRRPKMPMALKKKPLFIALEGIEGAGKSTCVALIRQWLKKKSVPHIATREPGGSRVSEKIRYLLLHDRTKITPETELLLLFAARQQHLQECIFPALQKGQWVICDRFTDASYAYQGGGRGIPDKKIALLEKWVQGVFKPDLTILLDISVKKALERLKKRPVKDRIEKEKKLFFHRVRKAYLARAKKYPQRYKIISAGEKLERVEKKLSAVMQSLF